MEKTQMKEHFDLKGRKPIVVGVGGYDNILYPF